LNAMVPSVRTWFGAVCWMSPDWVVTRVDRDAVGQYGEQYRWTRVAVIAVHNGRLASVCQFELEDEAAAFAYAEERMRATSSRLAVTNRASQTAQALHRAMSAADLEATIGCFSDRFVYDDRRRLSLDAPMWYGSGVGRSGEMPWRGGRMRFLQDQIRPQRRASRRCNYLIVGP